MGNFLTLFEVPYNMGLSQDLNKWVPKKDMKYFGVSKDLKGDNNILRFDHKHV